MDKLRYVIGMEIVRLLGIYQEANIKRVMECFRMHYFKLVNTPVEKGLTFSLDQCPKTNQKKERMTDVPYASVVGSLMCTMLCTRLDICFMAGLISYHSNTRPTY